jgi:MarR family transcriptional regulator, lower aerobic nicotinate degradation pathway regulator
MSHDRENGQLTALPAELLESTGYLLGTLGLLAKTRWSSEFEGTPFQPFHYGVLAVLDEGARDTQSAIAEVLRLDPSQLVGLLDTLEELGLIERHRDPTDRRRHRVSLTGAGRGKLATFRSMLKKVEDDFLDPLTPEERHDLHDLLFRLAMAHDPRCSLAESLSEVHDKS